MTGPSAGIVAAVLALCAPAAAAPRLGVMADVGVPDGAQASVVVHPTRMLRVYGGVGSNYVDHGVRGGIALVPFRTVVTPTLSLDYGRFFEGDANPLAQMLSGDPTFESPWLERVGYDYASAHLGLEIGGRRCVFFLHAGVSRITSQLHPPRDDAASVTFTDDPRMTAWVPSARLGLAFYLVK